MFTRWKKRLALLLALAVVLGAAAFPAAADGGSPSSWALSEVEEAESSGLVPADLRGNYQDNITRQDFCRLMVQLVSTVYDYDVVTLYSQQGLLVPGTFTDTNSLEVLTANQLGIVNGRSEGIFDPYGSITRQEAATMLGRTGRLLGLAAGAGISFSDAGFFASWAADGIAYVSGLYDPTGGKAVMGGTGEGIFSPLDLYTREQAILTALRLWHCAEAASGTPDVPTPAPAPAPVPATDGSSPGEAALMQLLHDAVWRGDSYISFELGDYVDAGTDVYALTDTIGDSLFEMVDLFDLGSLSYQWMGTQMTVFFQYKGCYGNDYTTAKAVYQQGVDTIVAQVDGSWSDLEKVVFLNTYFATHFGYDETLTVSDAFGFFNYGVGTCAAYTAAANAVLQRLGIPCGSVSSNSLNHTWNLVQLGGNWYHWDLTWDDPTPDLQGRSRGTYLLLSTEALRRVEDGEHYQAEDWVYSPKVSCYDTTYDNYFWRDARSPILPEGGSWYCVTADGLAAWDGSGNHITTLVTFQELFQEWYPYYTFSGYVGNSGLFIYGGGVYFNSSFNIIRYGLTSGQCDQLANTVDSGNNIDSCYLNESEGKVIFHCTNGDSYYVEL